MSNRDTGTKITLREQKGAMNEGPSLGNVEVSALEFISRDMTWVRL